MNEQANASAKSKEVQRHPQADTLAVGQKQRKPILDKA